LLVPQTHSYRGVGVAAPDFSTSIHRFVGRCSHFAIVKITIETEATALNALFAIYDTVWLIVRRMEFCSMGMITETEIGRFYAEDGMGNRYTVVRWQDKIVFRPSSGPVRKIPGKVRHSLVTGEQLDSRADGSLVIVNDNTVIRRVE